MPEFDFYDLSSKRRNPRACGHARRVSILFPFNIAVALVFLKSAFFVAM